MIATVEDGRLTALQPDKGSTAVGRVCLPKGDLAFTEVVSDPDR